MYVVKVWTREGAHLQNNSLLITLLGLATHRILLLHSTNTYYSRPLTFLSCLFSPKSFSGRSLKGAKVFGQNNHEPFPPTPYSIRLQTIYSEDA